MTKHYTLCRYAPVQVGMVMGGLYIGTYTRQIHFNQLGSFIWVPNNQIDIQLYFSKAIQRILLSVTYKNQKLSEMGTF